MLERIVELLGGLLLSALPLLIGSCIVGSIVAALRAVSGGSREQKYEGNERPSYSSGQPSYLAGLMQTVALALFQRVSRDQM